MILISIYDPDQLLMTGLPVRFNHVCLYLPCSKWIRHPASGGRRCHQLSRP